MLNSGRTRNTDDEGSDISNFKTDNDNDVEYDDIVGNVGETDGGDGSGTCISGQVSDDPYDSEQNGDCSYSKQNDSPGDDDIYEDQNADLDSNTNAVEDDDVPTDETESIDDPSNKSHRAQQGGVGNLVGDNAGANHEGADDEGSENQNDDEEKAFYVGKKIYSEKNLEEVISSYEKSMFCSLWKKDVRTLVAARKKTPKKADSAKPSLKYYTVLLKCFIW